MPQPTAPAPSQQATQQNQRLTPAQRHDAQRPNNIPTNRPMHTKSTPGPQQEAENTPICHHYRYGICVHGISGRGCHSWHPKPCQRLLKHGEKGKYGCNLGSDCTKFHPSMCQNSLKHRKCALETCNKLHVRGTRRPRPWQSTQSPSAQQTPRPNVTNKTQPQARKPQTKKQHHPAARSVTPQKQIGFLELASDMKTAINVLTQTVEAQGLMLANLMKERPKFVPQILPVHSQHFPWLNQTTTTY